MRFPIQNNRHSRVPFVQGVESERFSTSADRQQGQGSRKIANGRGIFKSHLIKVSGERRHKAGGNGKNVYIIKLVLYID